MSGSCAEAPQPGPEAEGEPSGQHPYERQTEICMMSPDYWVPLLTLTLRCLSGYVFCLLQVSECSRPDPTEAPLLTCLSISLM